MYRAEELGELVADSRARVVVATPECAAVARAAMHLAPEAATLVLIGEQEGDEAGGTGVSVRPWTDLLAAGQAAGPAAPYRTWFDSPAFWLYTSGTTGRPKAAMHRHGSVARVCETYAHQVLGIRQDDRCYSVAKLFFAYGLGNSLLFPFSVGATAVLDPARASPAGAAERLAADRPTLFFAGPAFFAALLTAGAPVGAFATVRLATSAGEALPAEIYRRFTGRYGVDIIDGLGSTEALHIFISNRPGEVRPGTSGTVVPGYQARLVDETGAPVADGEPGHLLVRGDSIATGYWCRTATTREVFQGEWLRTGDTYTRSADGFYTCLGRSNDMIKAGGIWVSPMEVEGRLLEHPAVAECAVVGHRNDAGLEEVVACVVAAPGQSVDADGLIAFCQEGLATFKRPRQVLALDALPKTATGKIQRVVVREVVARHFGKPGG
jgi:benzoate-CoA ligase family protein